MVLELHVYPPAFSLPSIDAHCIATIAYFSQTIPHDEWRLIATTPNNNPTGELPALRNGSIWVGGWANIVDYLRKLNPEWDLDATAEVKGMERGDVIAFSSFIQTRGQDLLDLSLYLSSTNYGGITRKTFSTFLPFPLSWILPHSLRAGAKARTAHLGLSALDVDSEEQPAEDKNPVPESLRRKDGPSSILSSPDSAAQIRLHALAKNFFQPLQELRGQGRFFVGDRPTTLDCLAAGYLSLMLFPDLPSPWLANTIRGEYPQIGAFVHDMQQLFFSGAVSLSDAGISQSPEAEVAESEKRGKDGLPWLALPTGGLLDIAKAVGGHMASNIPIISDVLKARRIQLDLEDAAEADPELVPDLGLEYHRASMVKKEILISAGSVVLGLGLFVAFIVKQGVLASIMGTIQEKVARREAEDEGFSWGAGAEEEGQVPQGLANLAGQMDFLGDMQFGAPPQHSARAEGGEGADD